jgi:hypothetical protein
MDHIVKRALDEPAVSSTSELAESRWLMRADTGVIDRYHLEKYIRQSEMAEREFQDQPGRSGAKAASPNVRLTDRDSELGRPMSPVDPMGRVARRP